MTPKERVKRALRHEKSDRVPRYDIFLPGFGDSFRRVFGERYQTPYERYTSVDIGTVIADQRGPFLQSARILSMRDNEKVEIDTWGRTLLTHTDGYFERVLAVTISDKSCLDQFDFSPNLHLLSMPDHEWLAKQSERFCPVSGCMGLFMSAWRLRGEATLLEDMLDDPAFVHDLVERTAAFLTPLGVHVATSTQTLDTAIWVYDEFSSRLGPLFSPHMFERYFLHPYKKMFTHWRKNGIENIILHCDGNSLPLFELFIEAGFSGVQSMAPTAGMYLPEVKKRFGSRLVLIGGMDNIVTLARGTREDIMSQTREILDAAKEGGVIVGTHSIDSDIPVENYDVYDEYMRLHSEME